MEKGKTHLKIIITSTPVDSGSLIEKLLASNLQHVKFPPNLHGCWRKSTEVARGPFHGGFAISQTMKLEILMSYTFVGLRWMRWLSEFRFDWQILLKYHIVSPCLICTLSAIKFWPLQPLLLPWIRQQVLQSRHSRCDLSISLTLLWVSPKICDLMVWKNLRKWSREQVFSCKLKGIGLLHQYTTCVFLNGHKDIYPTPRTWSPVRMVSYLAP